VDPGVFQVGDVNLLDLTQAVDEEQLVAKFAKELT